jgi:hypothetical protein
VNLRPGRRGRRKPATPHPGDMVIDGHVRARLLGVRLLELDAHIVVGTAPRAPAGWAAPIDATSRGAQDIAVPATTGRTRPGPSTNGRDALPLARAQRLLAEGSTVLAGARRIR